MIEVYTDGSCLGNPGTGGWAFLILNEGLIINHFGHQPDTTNNQMELTATIKALEYIKENDEISIDIYKLHFIILIVNYTTHLNSYSHCSKIK